MNKPLVSGIIIFLNAQKFIEEAIQSVFAQTYDNWELLLVDDGSTDQSTQIAQHYVEKYPEKVRYLEHENHQNLGMSAARNLGVANAQGEYIAFLDADDIWLPHKLQQQVAILESMPQAAMLYGRTLFWHSWSKPEDISSDWYTDLGVEHNTLVQPPNLLTLFLEKEGSCASTCSVLIRRMVFDKVGGFEPQFRDMYEDMVFYTKVFLHFPVFVSGQCWDRYRQHKDNSCSVAINTGIFTPAQPSPAREKFLNWVEEYLEQNNRSTDVWNLQQQLLPYRQPGRYQLAERPRQLLRQIKQVGKQIGRLTLPALTRRWLRGEQHKRRFDKQKNQYISQIGWVRFGNFRRVTPIDPDFGWKRGKPIDRYYIEKFLASQADDVRGRVLEMSDRSYTLMFGGDRVTKSDVMQVIDDGNPQVNIVADLTDCSEAKIPSNTYNCIILTQTLPFIYDVRAAVKTIYRILKPGGVLLNTSAGISKISPEDVELWGEYWRFTKRSSQLLFEEFFPSDHLTVQAYGNVFAAMTFLHGLATEEVHQQELDYQDPDYEVLVTLRAVKPMEMS